MPESKRSKRRRLRSQGFHKGQSEDRNVHTGWNVQTHSRENITRVAKEEHTFIEDNTCHGEVPVLDRGGTSSMQLPRNPAGHPTDYVCLRPKVDKEFYQEYEEEHTQEGKELIIVHREKTAALWNNIFHEHNTFNNVCTGNFTWNDENCEQRGLAWAMSVKCSLCHYASKKVKLYDEVDKGNVGRKAAVQNITVQVGLARNGISYTGLIDILASINIPPPSASSLQKAANKVNSAIVEANKEDMHNIREDLKQKKAKIGQYNTISVQGDATYNNRWSSASGSTPNQAATQATYLLCENDTRDKKIVAALTISKLCRCNLEGIEGPHLSNCTANLPCTTPIGSESLYLQQCIQDVHQDNLSIRDITIDGDFSARKTATEVIQPDATKEIEVQYCTRHLGKLLQKKLYNAKFTKGFFERSCRTVAQKQECQRLLSHDITKRVTAEFNQAYTKYGPDVNAMVRFCSYLPETIIKCYQGNCQDCYTCSLVCSEKNPWRRPLLSVIQRFAWIKDIIKPTQTDCVKLRDILSIRLSAPAVRMTYRNHTQNKCEGANRGISKSNPKHITHSRNYHGRSHAAIHSMNNGPGASLLKMMKVLRCPMAPSSRTMKCLKTMDRRRFWYVRMNRSMAYKTAKSARRDKRYQVWDQNRKPAGYKKFTDIVQEVIVPAAVSEHTYNRRKRSRLPIARKL